MIQDGDDDDGDGDDNEDVIDSKKLFLFLLLPSSMISFVFWNI